MAEPASTSRHRLESRTDRLYMQALMLQEKKKAKAAEVDRECTFSPRLVAQEKRPTKGTAEGTSLGGGNRFSRLYAQAEATRSKLTAAREALDPECTFKPTLAAKSPTATMRQSTQVFDTLYAKAVAQQQRLEEKRKTAGLKDCTFSPALNPDRRKSKGVSSRKSLGVTGGSNGASEEDKDADEELTTPGGRTRKLYDPEWWKRRLDPEHNNPEARQAEACTFKPQLVAKPVGSVREAPVSGQAVFDKLFRDAEKLNSKLDDKVRAATQTEEAECTFTPDLSLTKDVLEGHSMNVGAAHERLYRQAMELNQKRSQRPELADECTFSPTISNASKQLSKALRRTSGGDRLHEMYAEGLVKQKQRSTEAAAKTTDGEYTKDDEENCTFKPAITAWPGLENVSNMPVHERLYSNAFSRTQARMLPEDDVDAVLSASGAQPVAVDGSRRYVQGGELYLI